MKKVILISNYYHFASEKLSNRYRTLAERLAKEPNIEVEVVTSTFYQRTKKHRDDIEELTKGIPYKATFIYEPGYKKNISFQRLRTSKIFAKNVLKYLESQPKPDLIYQVVPTLDVADVVSKYAKKRGIPFVIDVQDLWPEAFKMAINIPVLSDIAFLPFTLKANRIYKRADGVCAVSDTYVSRVLRVNKKVKVGCSVYIGIDLNAFEQNTQGSVKICDKVKLAYCGSLEKSYDIKLVIDALSIMKNPPQFIVMGDGELKNEFERYAKENGVDAVFTGFMPYYEMCKKMCECDITINPIIGQSVASIINKHGDYAASGLPVVNTQNSKEYRALVDKYNMGFNCVGKDAAALAECLTLLAENPKLRAQMGENAKRCAREKFDRNITYEKIVKTIQGLL